MPTKNKELLAAANRRYREGHREELRLAAVAFRAEHPEYAAGYREANRESLRAKSLVYSEANSEAIRKRAQRRRQENPERVREIFFASRTRCRESYLLGKINSQHLRRASYRGEFVSSGERGELIEYFNSHCAYCIRPLVQVTLDHIVPLSKGGEHSIGNIVPACQSCNSSKGSLSLLQLLARKVAY